MKIYLIGEDAFVDLGKGYLLCIGKKAETDGADGPKLARMVEEAIVMSQYMSIQDSRSQVRH